MLLRAFKYFVMASCAFCAVAVAKADQVPKFSQFPARTYSSGVAGRLDLSNPQAYSYRTRLREGAQQPANFAGHYRVVTWGCGTNCGTGAIIDALTGHVIFLPTVITYQMEHELDADFNFIAFRLDSRLIVFAGQINDQGEKATFFMDFDGREFRRVFRVLDKGVQDQPEAANQEPQQTTDTQDLGTISPTLSPTDPATFTGVPVPDEEDAARQAKVDADCSGVLSGRCTLAHDLVGCVSEEIAARVRDLIDSGDEPAALSLVALGCRLFNAGSYIYVEDVSFWHSRAKFHTPGNPLALTSVRLPR